MNNVQAKRNSQLQEQTCLLERITMGTKDASPIASLQQMNLMLRLNLECFLHGVLLNCVLSSISEAFYFVIKMNIWGHFNCCFALQSIESSSTPCLYQPAAHTPHGGLHVQDERQPVLVAAAGFWLCGTERSSAHKEVKFTASTAFFFLNSFTEIRCTYMKCTYLAYTVAVGISTKLWKQLLSILYPLVIAPNHLLST